jgi:small subunit ribosomal protein S6
LRGYELCLILQHETTEENIDQKVKNLQEKAVSNGGDIIKIEKWGKRSLKYAIKKQQKGYYCFVTVTGDNNTLHEIERMFKYDESVLRYSYLRLDEAEITAIIKSQDPAKTADDEPVAKDESTPTATDEPVAKDESTPAATDEPVADEASDNNETADIEI